MSDQIPGLGVFVVQSKADLDSAVETMNKATAEWTLRAARGECGWICSDCCCSFPQGMPDQCEHGHAFCTAIIQRDKAEARAAMSEGGEQA